MLQIQCIESKNEQSSKLFSKFSISPLPKSQGLTIGNAVRRTLLSNLEGVAIIGVRISDVTHEFSLISGLKEDILEILLNIKQIVLKGSITEPVLARLNFHGPGIITAQDIEFPDGISLIDPQQYITTVTSAKPIEMEFLISNGNGYSLSDKVTEKLPEGFLAVDAVFMPVQKVNFFIETSQTERLIDVERLILEISTNGSITPIEALTSSANLLQQIFGALNVNSSPVSTQILLKDENIPEKSHEFESILIEELELSVRAYNCLKRANIHTLKDLLQYSQDELLEFKNFGQKSADEVCDSLQIRFNKTLKK